MLTCPGTRVRGLCSKHEQWLIGHRFDDAALRATYAHYRAMLTAREAELAAVEADLAHWYTPDRSPTRSPAWPPTGQWPTCERLTIASEVGDWRRFPAARTFMGFTGLVPSEYSSG